MKKSIALLFLSVFAFTSCLNEIEPEIPVVGIKDELKISESVGLKLETPFITESVKLNVKIETPGIYIIKIIDISNRTISKEEIQLKEGDNVVTINTTILPSSAYRLSLSTKNNVVLGITDFNKIQ
jgi:hypothetical protein